jgi:sugar phosphate isomerase/epimerase
LGVKYLSMHSGFLDHTDAAYARTFATRIRCLADAAAARGVTLLMETGQETAEDLRVFLEELDHPAVGVNFDPANMILYDMGVPAEAVRTLGPWIRHVHIKDAVRTKTPGAWGTETPWGEGEVGGERFLAALATTGFRGVVAVEREGGPDRAGDLARTVERLSTFAG